VKGLKRFQVRTRPAQNKITTITAVAAFLAVLVFASAVRAEVVDLTPQKAKMKVPISLNCKDEEISNLINYLAYQYGINMIISKEVKGTITLRLKDVSLDAAFNEILATANAVWVEKENIIHIYAKSEIPAPPEDKLPAPEPPKLITEIFSPTFVNSEQLKTVISPFLSDRGQIQLFKDTRSTSEKPQVPIITDEQARLDTIRGLIKQLDTETRQVHILAKIVETSVSDSEVMGVDWTVKAQLDGTPFKFGSQLAEGGNIKLGTLSFNQFGAVLQRLSEAGKTNVLSDISLATLDGEEAEIHIGETIPRQITTIGAGGQAGVNFGTTGYEDIQVGVKLKVTPHILNDELVQMEVKPEISSVRGFTTLGSGIQSQVPITNNRNTHTNIMVKSGETIVIGGLIQDTGVETKKKVPLLGDLPLVGSLFRHKDSTTEKTDLIIFITAVIMDKRTQ
jgi:type II secretory pathway component GspD/PulD (secretin)